MKSIKHLILCVGLLFLMIPPTLQGQIFWSQPFQRWSHDQALSLLTDSPWASQVVLSGPSRRTPSTSGEAKQIYTVRLFSALPVRQAFLRIYQTSVMYEQMNPDERRRFEDRFQDRLEL